MFFYGIENILVFNTLEEYAQSLYIEFLNSENNYKQILTEVVKNEYP